MERILNSDGNLISQSRNLAGIRRYVSTHIIKQLDVCEVGHGEGQLSILFDDGSNFQTNFAEYSVLLRWVSRWRNVYGAPLSIGGKRSGYVGPNSFDCQLFAMAMKVGNR